MRRSLVAMLAADIAGYSRLMEADETETLEALRTFRTSLFAPAVAGHRGKVVKSMGDGWLVEFASVLDSVECAMQIQDSLAAHPTIRLRIGLHVGDVIHEDEDFFGDSVNVASRLQEIADPGSIVVSDQVYSSLDGTLAPSFDNAGRRNLKNIARPVRVWVRNAPTVGSRAAPVEPRGTGFREGFPLLMVSPVGTSDRRAEVGELAAALTNDIATYLGSPGWIATSIDEHRKAGAYVLDATLRTRGNRLRLEVRLLDPSGAPIWSAKFDGNLEESFDWQDEVGEEVSACAIGLILDTEQRRLAALEAEGMTAADCVLAGILTRADLSAGSMRKSLEFFRRAIATDPNLAQAYAEAINVYRGAANFGYSDVAREFQCHFDNWLAASAPLAAMNSSLDLGHAWIDYTRHQDPAALRSKLEKHLRLSPFDPEILHLCCIRYAILGEPEMALDCYRRFERLGRFSPFREAAAAVAALAHLQLGRDEAAITLARKALAKSRDFSSPYRVIAAANAHLGRREEASEAVSKILQLNPDETVSSIFERLAYAEEPGNRRFREGLRRAGLPE